MIESKQLDVLTGLGHNNLLTSLFSTTLTMTHNGNSAQQIVDEVMGLLNVWGPGEDALPLMLIQQQLSVLISSLHYQLKSLMEICVIVQYTLVPELVYNVYYFFLTVQDK